MPWKIHNVELDGRTPYIHLRDARNRRRVLNLEIELTEPRAVHIYIGSSSRQESRLGFDLDSNGCISVHATGSFSRRDLVIFDSILETMGYPEPIRDGCSDWLEATYPGLAVLELPPSSQGGS